MSPLELSLAFHALAPHVLSVMLICSRLLPVAFLCPVLGGSQVPSSVKLGLVLTLGMSLHVLGGVELGELPRSNLALLALSVRELGLGVLVGLIAGLPFDAARMAGRFIDLLRGTSAESFNPVSGTRESAAGDMLHQLILTLASVGIVLPLLLTALFRSFALVKLGGYVLSEPAALQVATLAGTAMGTGLAVGAPVAAVTLATDCMMGLLSRAVPQLNLKDLGAPLKILGGGSVLWLSVGVVSTRLLENAARAAVEMTRVLGG